MSSCNDQGTDNLCGMDSSLVLDIRNVACSPETELAAWNMGPGGVLRPFLPSTVQFGFSIATTRRGSLAAVVGMDDTGGFVSLYRSSGTQWTLEGTTAMRPDPVDPSISQYGFDIQMADVVPHAVANQETRTPVHVAVVAQTSTFATPSNPQSESIFLDMLYCRSPPFPCVRPVYVFDVMFYNTVQFLPGAREDYIPFADTSDVAEVSSFTTMQDPLSFSLSEDGRYLALGIRSFFTIQEWQHPLAENGMRGAWIQSFGTKYLGLNENGRGASILYMDISDGLGNNTNDEVVLAVGMIWSDPENAEESLSPIAVPLMAPENNVEGPLHVQVYRWSKGSEPEPLGESLESVGHLIRLPDGTGPPFPRRSVQLSEDGQVLLISSYFKTNQDNDQEDNGTEGIFSNAVPMVKVYELGLDDNDDSSWELRQSFELQNTPSLFRASCSLSWDGSVVTIAETQSVYIYEWDRNIRSYIQQGDFRQDSFAPSVVVWGDASTVLVSSPYSSDATSGMVEVYRDNYATACRRNETHPLLMHLSIQSEVSRAFQWSVVQKSTNEIIREGPSSRISAQFPVGYQADLEMETLPYLPSFVFQECFAETVCSSMSVRSTNDGSASSFVPSLLVKGNPQFVAFFNGRNLTQDVQFNAALPDPDTVDCELIIGL